MVSSDADGQRAARLAVVAGGAGGVSQQPGDAAGVRQQALAGSGQRDAAAVAFEQSAAKFGFQRADASGDVGLDGVQLVGRAVHAAGAGDGFEHMQVWRCPWSGSRSD